MKAELIEKWACAACDRIHSSHSSAQDCCEPEEELVCSVCDKRFSEGYEVEAQEHIAEHIASPIPSIDPNDVWKDAYIRQLQEGTPPIPAYAVADRVVSKFEREAELAAARARKKTA